jgi:hypothetical protein
MYTYVVNFVVELKETNHHPTSINPSACGVETDWKRKMGQSHMIFVQKNEDEKRGAL